MRCAPAPPIRWSKAIGGSSTAITRRLALVEFEATQQFYRAVDEVGNFLRPRTRMAEVVSLRSRRQKFIESVEELESIFPILLNDEPDGRRSILMLTCSKLANQF